MICRRIAVIWFLALGTPAFAAEQFVVVDVVPDTQDVAKGAVYESAEATEFIFVPQGVNVLLLGKDGERYLIAGKAAVPARRAALEAYRVTAVKSDAGGIIGFFLGTSGDLEFLATGRRVSEDIDDVSNLALMLPVAIDLATGKGERYCIFSDQIALRRASARTSDQVVVEAGGTRVEKAWPADASDLLISGFDLPVGRIVPARITTLIEIRDIELLRLPASLVEGDAFKGAGALAARGCAVQATMLGDSLKTR